MIPRSLLLSGRFLLLPLLVLAGWTLRAPAPVRLSASLEGAQDVRVLVFTRTTGFRHESIPDGIDALRSLGATGGFAVDATEDPSVFSPESLARYAAVVFLNTSGDVLDDAQQTAFEAYYRAGGGLVGIHGAATTEVEWPWFRGILGAGFTDHPEPQPGAVLVEDPSHPSTKSLPLRWELFDEWYNFDANPRAHVHVLATIDERSYEGGTMGYDHPVAWAHADDGGRFWYTALGHTRESYAEPLFREHVLGGIRWAAGIDTADVGTTRAANYEKVVLLDAVTDPMELDVAPDGSVFVIERAGAIKQWDASTDTARQVGFIPVNMTIEDGLLGLALDPGFADNHWLYVYYAPIDGGPQRLSRFTFREDHVDAASEVVLLEVETQRELCCHSAGSLAFDRAGNLYLSTGDNTMPSDREGSPLDERPGRVYYDSQRTAGNTNDLRGKILRIHPEPDGTYTIPDDNLFEGDAEHRPEIYTMGHRNPFRIAIDPETGALFWGDVGNGDPPNDRGPWGWDEWNRADGPGFFGWPYFAGANEPYRDYDYATGSIGAPFDPDAPVNDSPNNTGARDLPPAQPALIWYTYGESEDFPELGAGGINPMAGPLVRTDAQAAGPYALPPFYDGTLIIYEWMRNWVKVVRFDEESDVLSITPFLEGMPFVRPMDMAIGPEGRLYVVEWGDEFWGSNANAQVVRLDYYGSPERPPRAVASATPRSGPAPLRVAFSGTDARGPDGAGDASYSWDLDGDGTVDAREPAPAFTYDRPGRYTARLTVTDAAGRSDTASVHVVAGNTRPDVAVAWPLDGGIFDYDEPVPYRMEVADVEDAAIAGDRVFVTPYAGFDTHRLPLPGTTGLEGTLRLPRDTSHRPDLAFVDRYVAVDVRYTDTGAPGAPALTGRAEITLQPRQKEAEHAAVVHEAGRRTHGVHPAAKPYGATALTVMTLRAGSYLGYAPINLRNITSVTLRLKPQKTATYALRLDAPDGPLLARIEEASAGQVTVDAVEQLAAVDAVLASGKDTDGLDREAYLGWINLTVPVTDPGGTHTLYLVVESAEGGPLAQLDWIAFGGPGMHQPGDAVVH